MRDGGIPIDVPFHSATGPAGHSQLTVSGLSAGAPLVDFPLLVVLDDKRADLAAMASDDSDVRFYDDGGNVLASEIEQAGDPGVAPLVAWVRIPSLVTGTILSVTYGATPTDTSTSSVWSDAYLAVWHLSDSGVAHDATGHQFDGTPTGTKRATGQIGGGRAFDNANPDWITVTSGTTLTTTVLTMSAWINQRIAPPTYFVAVSREAGSGDDNALWLGEGNGALAEASTTNSGDVPIQGPAIATSHWTHLAATVDGTTGALYVDGSSAASASLVGSLINDPLPVFLGAARDGDAPAGMPDHDFVDGTLDEIRLENVVRPVDWLVADDASQRDQLITYGPIQH